MGVSIKSTGVDVVDVEQELIKNIERAKSNSHRLDKVEKRQDEFGELVTSVKVLAEREQSVETDVKEIKDDVKTLTTKPGKRWDSLVDKIIFTIAAGVVGYILAKFGF